MSVFSKLWRAEAVGELWIDGSFLTEKIDPADVDVVFRVDGPSYDLLPQPEREAIEIIVGEAKAMHRCHTFLIPGYPDGHPQYWYSEYSYVYWMKQWGFSRP